jgi:hypothetical protein
MHADMSCGGVFGILRDYQQDAVWGDWISGGFQHGVSCLVLAKL